MLKFIGGILIRGQQDAIMGGTWKDFSVLKYTGIGDSLRKHFLIKCCNKKIALITRTYGSIH